MRQHPKCPLAGRSRHQSRARNAHIRVELNSPVARGQLFQKGLIVESTYVDPGFQSSDDRPGVHLMVFNATQKAITLQAGMPVARLELIRLSKNVDNPHGGASFIGQVEQAAAIWPWPIPLGTAAEEAQDAFRVRDIGARLIAMDRQTHALRLLIKQVDDLTVTCDFYKLFIYWATPWLIALALAALNIEKYLAGDALAIYVKFRAWIDWGTVALIGIIVPVVLTCVKADARKAVRRLIGLTKPTPLETAE